MDQGHAQAALPRRAQSMNWGECHSRPARNSADYGDSDFLNPANAEKASQMRSGRVTRATRAPYRRILRCLCHRGRGSHIDRMACEHSGTSACCRAFCSGGKWADGALIRHLALFSESRVSQPVPPSARRRAPAISRLRRVGGASTNARAGSSWGCNADPPSGEHRSSGEGIAGSRDRNRTAHG